MGSSDIIGSAVIIFVIGIGFGYYITKLFFGI